MPRYVDLDKAIERLKASPAFPNFGTDGYFLLNVVEDLLKHLPIADVVPRAEIDVVRCKDCKYWQDNNGGYPHEGCRWWKNETPDADDYCSYGERMEDGECDG